MFLILILFFLFNSILSTPSGVQPLWCGDVDILGTSSYAGTAPTHIMGQPITDDFAVAYSGLYLRGKGVLGIELISMLSAVCINASMSVPVNTSASPPQIAAYVALVSSPHAATASERGCLFVAMTNVDSSSVWPPPGNVNVEYWLRPTIDGETNCSTRVFRAPDFRVLNATLTTIASAVGAQASARAITECPTSIVPSSLKSYALARPAVDLISNASVLEGFVPGGFVAALLGGLVTTTRCAYSVYPITSFPYTLAYEVVFGSAQSGYADSCGWFAHGPGKNLTYMMNTPANLVLLNESASICPQSWVPAQLRTLVDYFNLTAPTAAPTASLAPTLSSTSSVSASDISTNLATTSSLPSGTVGSSQVVSPSSIPTQSTSASSNPSATATESQSSTPSPSPATVSAPALQPDAIWGITVVCVILGLVGLCFVYAYFIRIRHTAASALHLAELSPSIQTK